MKQRVFSVNDELLDTWTQNAAWLIGLICADGYITKDNRRISFHMKDTHILQQVKTVTKYTGKIYKTKTNTYRMEFLSPQMVSKLNDLGITNCKSLTLQLPEIPNQYFGSFLCGYFDGDGSFWLNTTAQRTNKKLRSQIIGSDSFITDLNEKLVNLGLPRRKLYKAGKAKKICYAHRDSLLLGKIMYNNTNHFYWDKFWVWLNELYKSKGKK